VVRWCFCWATTGRIQARGPLSRPPGASSKVLPGGEAELLGRGRSMGARHPIDRPRARSCEGQNRRRFLGRGGFGPGASFYRNVNRASAQPVQTGYNKAVDAMVDGSGPRARREAESFG